MATDEEREEVALPSHAPSLPTSHAMRHLYQRPPATQVRAWLTEHKVAEMMETVLKTTITARPTEVASFMAAGLRKMTRADKPICFFVLGGPGAGKGTQCAKIVETFGYTHLSAGDLLRAERESGSEQGEMIQGYITEGKIVPVEVTIKLIMKAVEENGGKRFLIDGFPRNTNNLSGWQQVAGDAITLAGVLCYDVSEEVLQERLLKRGETSGRADDNMESIQKRFVTFKSESLPVVQYYEHQAALPSSPPSSRPSSLPSSLSPLPLPVPVPVPVPLTPTLTPTLTLTLTLTGAVHQARRLQIGRGGLAGDQGLCREDGGESQVMWWRCAVVATVRMISAHTFHYHPKLARLTSLSPRPKLGTTLCTE